MFSTLEIARVAVFVRGSNPYNHSQPMKMTINYFRVGVIAFTVKFDKMF